ncbi:hypothetical protein OSTOST_00454, partial [Ostertagia ostertagi]
ANITNPECWPLRAILAVATIIYFLVTGCYVFLYVPIIFGKPFRVLAAILWSIIRFLYSRIKKFKGRTSRRGFRNRNLAEIIAILVVLIAPSKGCQAFTTIVGLTPNLPTQWRSFRMTLTSLAFPPTPLLNTYFISDSRRTALWKRENHIALRCPDRASAQLLNCTLFDDCRCTSAETHVNCRCTDFSISDWFNSTRNQLPVVFPAITFSPHRASRVQARVFSMVTAEVVITFQDAYKPALLIDEATYPCMGFDLDPQDYLLFREKNTPRLNQ